MFQVPAPTTPGAWTAAKYLSTNACRSPGWPCIHIVAAWQAWKYSSSVDRAGKLILVVTPAGEIETTPGSTVAAGFKVLGGVTGVSGPFSRSAEQPVIGETAVNTTTVPHTRGRNGRHRTPSIYVTLTAVTQRTGFWECCRP
jgi:hypothetical protein